MLPLRLKNPKTPEDYAAIFQWLVDTKGHWIAYRLRLGYGIEKELTPEVLLSAAALYPAFRQELADIAGQDNDLLNADGGAINTQSTPTTGNTPSSGYAWDWNSIVSGGINLLPSIFDLFDTSGGSSTGSPGGGGTSPAPGPQPDVKDNTMLYIGIAAFAFLVFIIVLLFTLMPRGK